MTDISDKKHNIGGTTMSDEIRNEEIEVTETVEAEDVKEGLSATDCGVIGGIMIGGILLFEGGKWVWKKTEAPRKKVKGFVTGIFSKKPAAVEAKDVPEQEVATEKATEKSEEKKSDKKGNSKK